jgi:hypothetical protein
MRGVFVVFIKKGARNLYHLKARLHSHRLFSMTVELCWILVPFKNILFRNIFK